MKRFYLRSSALLIPITSLIFFFSSFPSFSQIMPPELKAMEQRLDSLKGEERFSFLMELAQAYAQVDVQQSRGFLKEANRILTWEMLITLKQQAIKGDNVILFTRRKR